MTTSSKVDKAKKEEVPPLLHPPLIEAIFEIRWELEGDPQTGRVWDVAYPMLFGRLYERMKEDFPLIEDLPATQMHPEASPFVVRHRMRREKGSYPLIQIGPGIATVNEARGYSWTSFRSVILRLIEAISELFPAGTRPLNFIKSEVRYVNGIRLDLQRDHPLAFLSEKLHTKVELDPDLFQRNEMSETPNTVGLNLAYVLHRPVGNLALSTALGHVDGKAAYIVQIIIQSMGETVPHNRNAFEPWLQKTHAAAENCFLALCKGSLMEKFCGA